jgi:hypothetical protein
MIRVMTNEPVDGKRAKDGTPVLFTVSEDVLAGDALAIPRGAIAHGVVVKSRKAGRLTGSPELILELTSLDLGGRSYPLYTYQLKVTGTSKTKPTEAKALRGAHLGATAGNLAGGVSAKGGSISVSTGNPVRAGDPASAGNPASPGNPISAGAGAAVGAGAGTAVSAATPGPEISIPAEAQADFYLAAPIAVTPVSAEEAERLGEGLRSGAPSLYLRGETP